MQPAHKGSNRRLVDRATLHKMKTKAENKFTQSITDFLNGKHVKLSSALDSITYGIKCKRVKGKTLQNCTVMMSETQSNIYLLINIDLKTVSKFDLTEITLISFDASRGEFTKLKEKDTPKRDTFVGLLCQPESFDLIFENSSDLEYFIKSIEESYTTSSDEADALRENIKRVWITYDNDFSGKMERREFAQFAKDLKLNLENKSIDELFLIIDSDKSGEIDFEEFVVFYKKFTSGAEFKSVFDIYSKSKSYMTPKDLQEFFTKEQGEVVTVEEAAVILLNFIQNKSEKCEGVLKKLTAQNTNGLASLSDEEKESLILRLEDFKHLLYDQNYSNIYDSDKIHSMQDMKQPIYKYLINSSHNTYLKGHQLHGESSVEMYNYALLNGYRLVELDCWNGDDVNGPIITHGWTLTSNILLKDVLQAIRQTAFLSSDYPVILSIENHCNRKQQEMMANFFKLYLKDLYVVDDVNVPGNYPSPAVLRGRFIIKCGREPIIGLFNEDNLEPSLTKMTLPPLSKDSMLRKMKNVTKAQEDPSLTDRNSQIEQLENSMNINKSNVNDLDHSKIHAGNNGLEPDAEGKTKKKEFTKSEGSLAKCCGMVGRKLKLDKVADKIYQPWDCITITEEKTKKYVTKLETKKQLISYTRRSFGKAYPLRMDSSNLDPVKCWLAGMQIAAINCQSLSDDFTLLNMIFFKQNGNCGYVLKPEKLNDVSNVETYDHPLGMVSLSILSAMNLHLVLNNINRDLVKSIKVETNMYGSYEDDENNKTYSVLLEGNFLNPSFANQEYKFNVYEKDLACIFLRISHGGEVLARGVIPLCMASPGYRVLTLYDKSCKEIKNCVLIVHFKKEF